MRAAALIALCVIAALAVAGCGEDAPKASTAPLPGTQWQLDTTALEIDGAESVSSFLAFGEDTRASGSDGCNEFSGPYEVDGPSLRFGPLASTQRACFGAAQAVAALVAPALEQVRSYATQAGTLILEDGGGEPLLRYRASVPGIDGPWEAVSVLYGDAIRGVIEGTTPTADFGADGRVTGSGGCNTFSGPFTAGGRRLQVGPLASTRKACSEPEGADEQERGYLAALESAVRFEQAGPKLTLFNAKGQMAVTLVRPS